MPKGHLTKIKCLKFVLQDNLLQIRLEGEKHEEEYAIDSYIQLYNIIRCDVVKGKGNIIEYYSIKGGGNR